MNIYERKQNSENRSQKTLKFYCWGIYINFF